MIIHESIEIFKKNIFFLFLLSIISQDVFLKKITLIHRLYVFFIFITKNTNANGILFFFFFSSPKTLMPMEFFFFFFFSILWTSLILTENVTFFKSNLFVKSLSIFVIFLGLWSVGLTHLTKHHLKHSLSSVFWILIKAFLGWSNSSGNLIYLLPGKGSYFEILIVWSMTESIIQPESFPKDLCMIFY